MHECEVLCHNCDKKIRVVNYLTLTNENPYLKEERSQLGYKLMTLDKKKHT